MIKRFIKEDIKDLEPYVAGATKEEAALRHGLRPEEVIKLASNENPYGPPPKAVEAIEGWSCRVNLYPEDYPRELIEAISGYVNVPAEMILPGGNGADEAMDTIFKMLLSPGDEVLLHSPTFPYYRILTRLYGGRAVEVPMTDGYGFPAERIIEGVTDRTKLIVICSPNNPTGTAIGADEVKALLDTGLPVMLDEAYVEFADTSHTGLVREYENLVVLRTFSKAFGLAGLRVGYALAHPDLTAEALKAKPPHNVNLLAQKAAAAALGDLGHMRESVEKIRRQRSMVFEELAAIEGVKAYPSQANFHLIDLSGSAKEARGVVEGLERRGIIVRWCAGFGLPDCIRVTVGTEEENRRFLAELKEVLG
ncbi:MAG: histidinol-phosphate transaminase [Methanobacteriota archaeon]|nr:MAG: histidinol-phosphate transaminase [Euryarchaeota archaeon]